MPVKPPANAQPVEPRPVAAVRDLSVGGEVLAIRERSAAAVRGTDRTARRTDRGGTRRAPQPRPPSNGPVVIFFRRETGRG